MFIESFKRLLRAPALPNRDAIDYLPTQILAEYLCNVIEPKFDGLLFRSSLTDKGKNAVVFSHKTDVTIDDDGFPAKPREVTFGPLFSPDDPPDYVIETGKPKRKPRRRGCAFTILSKKMEVRRVSSLSYGTGSFDVHIREKTRQSSDTPM